MTIADVSGNEDDGIITVTASLDSGRVGTATTGDSDYIGISSANFYRETFTLTPGYSKLEADETLRKPGNDWIFRETLTFTGTAGETQTFTLTPGSDSKLEADEIVSISQTNLSGTSLSSGHHRWSNHNDTQR